MKIEGDFNAFLSKDFKRYAPKVAALKIADKFTVGISDFIIWANGRTLAMETKFILALPARPSTLILPHAFSGAQRTFLETMDFVKNMAYGCIGINEEQSFYLIEHKLIPPNGNFTREQFEACDKKLRFGFKETERFLETFFGRL